MALEIANWEMVKGMNRYMNISLKSDYRLRTTISKRSIMKELAKHFVSVLLILVGIFVVDGAYAYDLSDYLPIVGGSNLVYDQTVDGVVGAQEGVTTGSDTLVNGTLVNGTMTKPVTTSLNSGDVVQSQYLTWGSDGLQVHQRDEKIRTSADFQTFIGTFSSSAQQAPSKLREQAPGSHLQ